MLTLTVLPPNDEDDDEDAPNAGNSFLREVLDVCPRTVPVMVTSGLLVPGADELALMVTAGAGRPLLPPIFLKQC